MSALDDLKPGNRLEARQFPLFVDELVRIYSSRGSNWDFNLNGWKRRVTEEKSFEPRDRAILLDLARVLFEAP